MLYANDILLYQSLASVSDFEALQNDINKIQTWVSTNHMKFNESKCKVMHISHKRRPLSHSKSFILNNIVLESMDSYKHLGLRLSSNMSWSDRIEGTGVCRKGNSYIVNTTNFPMKQPYSNCINH